jgi:UDPglucose--hexose-1-phosphate uridylyltransferase
MSPPDGPAGLRTDPHRRHDPLQDQWVLVSPGRTRRPWAGASEPEPGPIRPAFDPGCPLCPGVMRPGRVANPSYRGPFVFDNDFAALRPAEGEAAGPWTLDDGLFRAASERGSCRVVCYSPRHDVGLGTLEPAAIRAVVDVWVDQSTELGAANRWVQVFENRGTAMGASNPHPHGQIWAASTLPVLAARELATQATYLATYGRSLLLDYVSEEAGGPREVAASDPWLTVVPFWAAWPFETLLIARQPVARLADLDDTARDELSGALRTLIGAYDGLFGGEFPYSMGWHQAPYRVDAPGWQLHAHLYPPLLREGVRKFMVGYELLAEAQRDSAPEDTAEQLREAAQQR